MQSTCQVNTFPFKQLTMRRRESEGFDTPTLLKNAIKDKLKNFALKCKQKTSTDSFCLFNMALGGSQTYACKDWN